MSIESVLGGLKDIGVIKEAESQYGSERVVSETDDGVIEKEGANTGEVNEPGTSASSDSIRQEFKKSCEAAGLIMKSDPIMDGRFHRVPVEKPSGQKNTDGSYKGFLDGVPSGIITNHYSGEKRKWSSRSVAKALSPSQRNALAKKAKENTAAMRLKVDAMHAHKANLADRLLSVMPKAGDNNGYLQNKGIKASANVHEDKKGRLVVPITDVNGKTQSFTRISSTGSYKSYMKGGKKQGGMHLIGQPKDGEPIVVAEGYSTGKSINEATGRPVAIAFDSGNLAAVAHAVQQAYTAATVFVAGDDDRANDRNVGRVKAVEAVNGVQTRAILPQFPAGTKGSDFNDLAKTSGSSEVKSQIESGIKRGRSEERHTQPSVKERGRSIVKGR